MKKKLFAVLAFFVSVSFTTGAMAYNAGDKLGDVLYSDIVAYIDGYPVPSYNIEGSLAVRIADLASYGLDARYDNAARASYVTYSGSKKITPVSVKGSAGKAGSAWQPYVYTDIKAYVNGKTVKSWNVGGSIVIPFKELDAFGSCVYDSAARASRLTLTKSSPGASPAAAPSPAAMQNPEPKDYKAGKIESFSTTDMNGVTYDESVFDIKPITFINYWATWCGPCRAELPEFQSMVDKYGDSVTFITIVDDGENNSAAVKLVNEYLGGYINLLPSSALLKPIKSGYVPTSVIVGRGGYLIPINSKGQAQIVGSYGEYGAFLDAALDKVNQ